MSGRQKIDRLLSVVTPYWAGESEVVRTYWTWSKRTLQTDMQWLARQCFKEFWGAGPSKHQHGGVFHGVIKHLHANAANVDRGWDRHDVLDALEGLKAEFSHYCAFADVHDAIKPAAAAAIDPQALESWPEEDKLAALRQEHRDRHGELGIRACKITEGGYCALFREGMALKGKPGIDGKIADACKLVFEDEFDHMLAGVSEVGKIDLSDAECQKLADLVVEQMRLRIRMRNAQFSFPMAEERVAAIFRGEIEPIRFDYARAKMAA